MKSYDANAMADAWSSGMSAAGPKYSRGVDAVDTAPGQLAVAHADAWLARTQAAFEKWKSHTGGVPLGDWKNSAKTTGAANLVSGATKGKPKQRRYWAAAGPILAGIVQEVRAMPNATRDQRRARMNRNVDLIEQRLAGAGR